MLAFKARTEESPIFLTIPPRDIREGYSRLKFKYQFSFFITFDIALDPNQKERTAANSPCVFSFQILSIISGSTRLKITDTSTPTNMKKKKYVMTGLTEDRSADINGLVVFKL